MRRSSPLAEALELRRDALVSAIADLDDATVARYIEVLAPFATPERLVRLQGVFAGRLDSVAVVLESPNDPHNGAAVIRTAEAFGVQRVHVIERTRAFLSAPLVARGTDRWVSVIPHRSGPPAADWLEERGFELIATHPEGELVAEDLAARPRIALVFGNERDGIFPDLAARCKARVRVEMRGFVESLNVSVTAGILLHHATRGRAGDLSADERQRLFLRGLSMTVLRASQILAAAGLGDLGAAPSADPG